MSKAMHDMERRRLERRQTLEEWYGKPKRMPISAWEIALLAVILAYGFVSCVIATPAWIIHWVCS